MWLQFQCLTWSFLCITAWKETTEIRNPKLGKFGAYSSGTLCKDSEQSRQSLVWIALSILAWESWPEKEVATHPFIHLS